MTNNNCLSVRCVYIFGLSHRLYTWYKVFGEITLVLTGVLVTFG